MLWHREDAEDATQEILMRIVMRLAQFEVRSRLKTWAYRLAACCSVSTVPIEPRT
jgi:DNA-directed RNA polymerase specialized sigma24 family protein